jgi:hypothetical protein
VGPGYGGGEASISVTSVSATIDDLTGLPLSGVPVQVSGLDLAFSGSTDANGGVTITVGSSLKKPMLRFGDALHTVELAAPVTSATMSFGTLVDAPLPDAGVPFVDGGSAVSNGVSLQLPAGASVAIDTLDYSTADSQLFRAVEIPVSNHQEDAVPGIAAYGLTLVFGTAPLETLFCPPATVSVPNSAGWAAGAAVEFWILGVDVAQQWAPYGDWVKVSDGQVSADGSTVSTVAGQGFPVLETFGVRLRP